ncbi:hypothetical protein EI555_014515 [Monodon monoceros]|uniref:Guanine nucleotide-binding protein subunit gamma n=1 Tax=Monodon monoceros TaxID=40151 RepID=A0A4U1EXE1_MONMO|nr:hypothetical protein EI555_014515 [Monodon monoceros]
MLSPVADVGGHGFLAFRENVSLSKGEPQSRSPDSASHLTTVSCHCRQPIPCPGLSLCHLSAGEEGKDEKAAERGQGQSWGSGEGEGGSRGTDGDPVLQVSQAAADLLAYCEAHVREDPLLIPVPASENPFREKKFFCTIL